MPPFFADPDALLVSPSGEPQATHGPLTRYEALSDAARYALAVAVTNRIRAGRANDIGQPLSLLAATTMEQVHTSVLDSRQRMALYEKGMVELEQRGLMRIVRRAANGDHVKAFFNRLVTGERSLS